MDRLKMEISTLEMRMANIAARLSAPRKGDRPDLLNEELEELAVRLKQARKACQVCPDQV